MKKQFTTAIEKKAFTFLVALVILFCTQTSFANSNWGENESKAAEITYAGLKDKGLVFKVDYKNELAESFQLIIKNGQNEILFAKKYDAKPLSTDILLSGMTEDGKLTFTIRSGKKDYNQSFEINTKVRTVSEFEVKGL